MKLKSWLYLLLNEYDLVSVHFVESAEIDPIRVNLIKLGRGSIMHSVQFTKLEESI